MGDDNECLNKMDCILDGSRQEKFCIETDSVYRWAISAYWSESQNACWYHSVCILQRFLPVYFAVVKQNKFKKLYVCKRSHHYRSYLQPEGLKLADTYTVDAVKRLQHFCFIENCNLQHAGAKHHGHTNLS